MDMRSCVGVFFLLSILLWATTVQPDGASERTFFIAADEVAWDYAPSGRDEASGLYFNETGEHDMSSSTGNMVIMGEEPPSTWVLPGPQR